MTVHHFKDTLERSDRLTPIVIQMLNTIEDVATVQPTLLDEQKKGDEKIQFRPFYIDNKFRANKYYMKDILVETTQNLDYQTLGWIDASESDFIFYGWEKDDWQDLEPIGFLIPLQPFKIWFNRYRKGFPQVKAYNDYGITLNRCVPIQDIPLDCILKIERGKFTRLPITLTHFLKGGVI